MDIWVVIATSCSECNSQGVKIFDHVPSETEVSLVEDAIGGMWCITTKQFRCEINGEIQTSPE